MPSKQYNNCLCAFTLYWGTCDWEYKEDVWAVCEHTAVPWRDLSMHTDICRDSRTSHRQMPREDCTFTDYWKWNNLYSSPASHWRKQPVQKRAAVVSVTVIPGLRRLGQEDLRPKAYRATQLLYQNESKKVLCKVYYIWKRDQLCILKFWTI